MKSYVFNFRGMALGGLAVVIAPTDKAAYEVALLSLNSDKSIRELFGRKLVEADLDISEEMEIRPFTPTTLYVWNGDY